MTAKWSAKSVEQIENILKTNAACGLSRKAARVRQKKGVENLIFATEPSSLKGYAFRLLGDLNSYLLIIAGVVAAVFDYVGLAAVIFVSWAVNVFLALFTYIKAEKTFDNAQFYSMPRARVVREGKLYTTDTRNVVRGDVILLRPGDIAPCDMRLVSSNSLAVLEYDEEKKQKMRRKKADARIYDEDCTPEQELNMVFAGAVVLSGEARGIAVDVGEDTCTFETMGELPLAPTQKIVVFEKLSKYCTVWSIFMLVLILPICVVGVKNGLFDSFMLGLALASSTVSEMLVAIGRIIVACSVTNAALIGDENKNTAIIKNISKIEKMPTVDALLILDESVFTTGETVVEGVLADNEKELLAGAMIASGVPNTNLATDTHMQSSDLTSLLEYAAKFGITPEKISKEYASVGFVPCSEYNFDTALVKEATGFFAYVKGDANMMLSRCSKFQKNGEEYSMTGEVYDRLSSFIKEEVKKHRRVSLVAKKQSPYNNLQRISAFQSDLTCVGLLSFADPILDCAKETLIALRENGVEVVFASDTNNSGLKELLSEHDLVGGVHYTDDVSKKRKIFAELKNAKKTVAAVGSKIFDLGILREADVSFTCHPTEFSLRSKESRLNVTPLEKEYGTEAAKKEADVIIKRATRDNYGISSILCALEYSRTVYRNLENMLKYLICMLFSRMLIVLFSVFLGLPVICASGVLFFGLIVDFFAVLVFAFEKPDENKKREFSSSVFDKVFKNNWFWILLGAILAALITILPFILKGLGMHFSDADVRAFSFVSLALSHLVVLEEASNDKFILKKKAKLNVIKFVSVTVVTILPLLFVLFPWLGTYFGVVVDSYVSLWFALVAPVLIFAISQIRKLAASKITL